MERELWRWIAWGLRRLPRRWPRAAVYSNREILAVLLWAALHQRSILWASRRSNWPVQSWRRRLPDQSTMSRRLRDPTLHSDIARLVEVLQRHCRTADTLIVDGKALTVSEFTGDADAATGWAAGTHAKGYRLHALIDSARRLLAWAVRPMNHAECVVAGELLQEAASRGTLPARAMIIADASYDSNPLHSTAASLGARLLAPRRRPDLGICKHRKHHPGRLEAVRFTESDPSWRHLRLRVRTHIARFFGASLGGVCGLFGLPPWARRLHRVSIWIDAKLAIYAAAKAARDSRRA